MDLPITNLLHALSSTGDSLGPMIGCSMLAVLVALCIFAPGCLICLFLIYGYIVHWEITWLKDIQKAARKYTSTAKPSDKDKT